MLTAAGGNRLSILGDPSGNSPVRVKLTAQGGQITLVRPGAVTLLDPPARDAGAGTALAFEGPLSAVNEALQWITFVPSGLPSEGAASLDVTAAWGQPDSLDWASASVPIEVIAVTGSAQVYDVHDFGATGDGVTDDAPAIRAAIAAAKASGGGTIVFPPGQYALHSFDPAAGPATHFRITDCDGLRLVGTGAALVSSSLVSSYVFYLDNTRRIEFDGFAIRGHFERSSSQISRRSVGAFYVMSTQRESGDLRIAQVSVSDCYFFLICASTLAVPTRVKGVLVENCRFENGFYGLNFQNNGDNFQAVGFETRNVVRSYFPYGVDSHVVRYHAFGGDAFTDCLIKAYQRDTTNIDVDVHVEANTSPDASCTLESQHNPVLQPLPAVLRNIRVHYSDLGSFGPKSVRLAYFQDKPSAIQTATCASVIFDHVSILGSARNATEIAVQQNPAGLVELTELNIVPARLELSTSIVPEELPAGSVVARFLTSDANPGEAFQYSLVSGPGSDDNGSFLVDRDWLTIRSAPLDYETKTRYHV